MEKLFVDTNVIIDFLIDRYPFSEHAAKLFSLAINDKVELATSSLCIANLYFVIRKIEGHKKTIKLIQSLLGMMQILPVDHKIIQQSVHAGFSDFEDAIQYHTALQDEDIQVLLTRNLRDYKKSSLAVQTPEQYLAGRK